MPHLSCPALGALYAFRRSAKQSHVPIGAAVRFRQPHSSFAAPNSPHQHTGGLTTTVSDSNGAALLESDQRTLARAPSGAAIYQHVRLLPRPFRSAQMQKWRRVGGTGGGLPPVVTVIDWGGGGLAVPDFREIHVIRGDLKNPAEARGRPQAKHRAATRQLQPSPECDAVHSKRQHAKRRNGFSQSTSSTDARSFP